MPRNNNECIRNDGLSIFSWNGSAKWAFKSCYLNDNEFDQAQTYVLQNYEEVDLLLSTFKLIFFELSVKI